jgi:predicted Zn-dependent protease
MRYLVLAALAVLAAACATSPLGRSQLMLVSDSSIAEQGVASFQQMQKEIPQSGNAKQTAYVQCVAGAITREIPSLKEKGKLYVPDAWEVNLFDSKDVNAFAQPGGKIGVFTGILPIASTPDQLSAVLGHEVSHVLARHSQERASANIPAQVGGVLASAAGYGQLYSLGVSSLFLLPYSRSHETEADLMGLDLMASAGFDPRQAIQLWQNMSKQGGGAPPEILSTHPSDETRISNLVERLPTALPLYNAAVAAGKKPKCHV